MNKTVCSSVVPTSKKDAFVQENTVDLGLAIVVQT